MRVEVLDWREASIFFFPFTFSFTFVFVLSTKTGSNPDCCAGLKNKCQSARVHRGTCPPEMISLFSSSLKLYKRPITVRSDNHLNLCASQQLSSDQG